MTDERSPRIRPCDLFAATNLAARAAADLARGVPRRARRPRTAPARLSSSATCFCTCIRCARTAGACAGRRRWGLGIAAHGRVPDHAGDRRPVDVLLQAVSRRGVRLDQGHPLRRAHRPVHPQHPPLGRQRDGGDGAPAHGPRRSTRPRTAGRANSTGWSAWGCWSITLGLSFTGYLLPWDQLAYWAITIGANIAQSPREVTDALGITQQLRSGRAAAAVAAGIRRGRRGGADPLLPAARDDPAAGCWSGCWRCISGGSARTAA